MLGKLTGAAAELAGTADITAVIRPADFGKQESLAYIFTEDGETPYFILKSKQDEYCWTDRAFVHLDGTSGLSKKRLVKRYLWSQMNVTNVKLETAGPVDLDIEIKFDLVPREGVKHESAHAFSIDIRKAELAALICLYKALTNISEIQARAGLQLTYAHEALERAAQSMGKAAGTGDGKPAAVAFTETAGAAFEWLRNTHASFVPSDFAAVFQRYIRWG